MGYLGYKPADKPLTSADITDSIITSAKIVDGTIVNADINASAAIASTKLSGVQGKFESQLLHVRDEKASGSDGGTNTASTFDTRTLNTVLTNEISGASLSSNQITLPSGTYFIHASAPAFMISQSRLRLRNITDSSTTLLGENNTADSSVASSCISFVIGRFTIASSKTFELQHIGRVQRGSGQGFGLGVASFGITEVFAQVLIWKVA